MPDEIENEHVVRATSAAPDAPSVVAPLAAQFIADLRLAYQGLDHINPDESLPILAEKFEKHRIEKHERDGQFVRDLQHVHSVIGATRRIGEFELHELGQRLDAWREEVRKKLREFLIDVPADDPLRCPVSLFGAMDYGRRETAHTRALAWMLDHRGEHGFKSSLAQELIKNLEGPGFAGQVSVSDATAEHLIDDGGRLDILVRGELKDPDGTSRTWMLLIEAKVDALEGDGQLQKYEKWIARNAHGRDVIYRVFLTPDGIAGTSKEWRALSFLQVACAFRNVYPQLKGEAGYDFLRYYISGVLKDLCDFSLPMTDAATCVDPYSFIKYLNSHVREMEGHYD